MRTHPLRLSLIAAAVLATLPGHVLAKICEGVVNARRDHRMGLAVDEPVTLQCLQGMRQHLLADPADPPA